MRKFNCYSAALVAAFSFGIVACGDDATPADTGPDATQETSAETTPTETTGETTAETTTETTPNETVQETTDPCNPNPCTAKAPTCNADGAVVSYGAGVCAAGECTYPETVTACEGDKVCAAGACVAGGDACDYTFDERVSYVTAIALGNQGNGDDTCCFDYTGDGKVDNALGNILKTAGTLLGLDINATVAEQITSGSLTLLLETKGVEDVTNDATVSIAGFYGADADEDMANNAAGTSAFTVDPSSFQSGTATPLISFPGAKITAGTMTAGPNLFQLSLPIVGAQLDLAVSETRLEGKVAVGPNGKGLTMGADSALGVKLGGVIKRTDLYTALNVFVASCTCVEYTNAADTMLIGEDGQCNATKAGTCSAAEDGEACAQLPGLCGTLLAFIQPDVDTSCLSSGAYDADDCSGTKDAISIGVWVKATSASIDGVEECAAP